MSAKPQGHGRRGSRRRSLHIVVPALVLLAIRVLLCMPWIRTEVDVRRFLADSTQPLSEAQKDRVAGYIPAAGAYDHPFRHRFFGLPISAGRQSQIAQAAIDRNVQINNGSIHYCVLEKYVTSKGRAFLDLPKLTGQAIRKGLPNTHTLVIGDEWDTVDNIANHVDLNVVFRSDDSALILACLISFQLDTLWEYREAC